MPFIVKCNHKDDLYMYWSTIIDAPLGISCREEMTKFLMSRERNSVDGVNDRFLRTDLTGSSHYYGGHGQWDDYGLIYHSNHETGWLLRENFTEFADRLMNSSEASVVDLLKPFEED